MIKLSDDEFISKFEELGRNQTQLAKYIGVSRTAIWKRLKKNESKDLIGLGGESKSPLMACNESLAREWAELFPNLDEVDKSISKLLQELLEHMEAYNRLIADTDNQKGMNNSDDFETQFNLLRKMRRITLNIRKEQRKYPSKEDCVLLTQSIMKVLSPDKHESFRNDLTNALSEADLDSEFTPYMREILNQSFQG